MDKPEFVPFTTDLPVTVEVLNNARINTIEDYLAAQSQPAAEPVGGEARELLAKVFEAWDAQCNARDIREKSCEHEYGPLIEVLRAALRTPAREVPDESVPSFHPGNGPLVTGEYLGQFLRAHGMAIVYREGPGHAE